MTWDQRAIFALVGGWEPCHEPPPRVDIVGLYGTGVLFKEPNPTTHSFGRRDAACSIPSAVDVFPGKYKALNVLA